MDKLNIGTAGIPITCKERSTEAGVRFVKELGLDNMELEFVRQVYLKEEDAKKINETRKNTGIVLSCHAPYFVNLNAVEKPKLHASINRILSSARIANIAGAFSVTFHSGFFMGMDKEKVHQNIKKQIQGIVKTLQDEGNPIMVSPEVTGKETQFGSLPVLLKISQEVEQVMPCIDFAHLHARTVGKYNTYKEFSEILESVEKALGKQSLQKMHIHVSGINYGPKGERNHLVLEESDFNYKDLLKCLKDYKVRGVIVCESPNIEKDAILMKKYYEKL